MSSSIASQLASVEHGPVLSPDSTRSRPPFVLVVDDEKVIADTLVAIFRFHHYEATAAYTGEQALTIAGTLAPALLVSDVVMPGMTGVALACAMKQLAPDCRILLVSGHAPADVLRLDSRFLQHEFTLLQKPLDPKVLLNLADTLAA